MNCSGFSWSESSNKAVILMTLYLGFLITFSHQWEYRYGKWSQIQLKDRLRLVSYDPVLRGVPKGSYANNPNGACLIPEFRQMVQIILADSIPYWSPHFARCCLQPLVCKWAT
ncbi:PREDICTED: uncharacterized protein LOC104806034 isoform X6 [Tarenaya hassleriana]|uniref:uncharacterized protein LOC104806034 isoform X6 n=1 Tax=Tarenaya hassleriana TaxID=28532 RepID=UPI0008FD4FEE|nr:PREDICTED: uncharacterized protein LOC104806034 isoform X6 [Tarenaya hassleriana]